VKDFDHGTLVKKTNDSHFSMPYGAREAICFVTLSDKLRPALAQTDLCALQVTFQLLGPDLYVRFLKNVLVTPRDLMEAKASKCKLFPLLRTIDISDAFAYDDSTVICVGHIAFHRFDINIQDISASQ